MFSQRNRELHKAVNEGNHAKVIQCLDVGPKRERKKVLDQEDVNGVTPLSVAAYHGYNSIVAALLDRGALVDQATYYGRSPLIVACAENKRDTVELLLARGANIGFRSSFLQRGRTPLHIACEKGHVDLVRLLLDHGADAKCMDRDGYSPLQLACWCGYDNVVQLMFDLKEERGVMVDRFEALAVARLGDNEDIVRCLLARGVDVPEVRGGEAPAIKALIDAAAPSDKRRLAHWMLRMQLHVVGPPGDHQGSARHRLLNCRHLARHLVSYLSETWRRRKKRASWATTGVRARRYRWGGPDDDDENNSDSES